MRGTVSSGFGARWGTQHAGIDISDGHGAGAPVFAASSGTVREARCTSPDCSRPGSISMPGYGNKVDIAHAGGVVTRYAHLLRITVKPGQRVVPGQLVGFEGATGNVTGAHLHFEVLKGGAATNPLPFLASRGVRLVAA
jgi:murein DD-endopeptidase MepM/ murein hydrolase activator NlpD